jgi:hypothetical protein
MEYFVVSCGEIEAGSVRQPTRKPALKTPMKMNLKLVMIPGDRV